MQHKKATQLMRCHGAEITRSALGQDGTEGGSLSPMQQTVAIWQIEQLSSLIYIFFF